RHAVGVAQQARRLLGRQAAAQRAADLDLEWIAAIHGRGSRARDEELRLADLLLQYLADQVLADGRDAVRRRVHELGLVDRLVERLGRLVLERLDPRGRVETGLHADLLGHARADAREVGGQEARQLRAAGGLHHLHEEAELDAVRVRLDLLGLHRQ